LIDAVAALTVLPHQPRAAQPAQVPGDRRTGNLKCPGDFPGGLAAPAQKIEKRAPRGVSKRLKNRGR